MMLSISSSIFFFEELMYTNNSTRRDTRFIFCKGDHKDSLLIRICRGIRSIGRTSFKRRLSKMASSAKNARSCFCHGVCLGGSYQRTLSKLRKPSSVSPTLSGVGSPLSARKTTSEFSITTSVKVRSSDSSGGATTLNQHNRSLPSKSIKADLLLL